VLLSTQCATYRGTVLLAVVFVAVHTSRPLIPVLTRRALALLARSSVAGTVCCGLRAVSVIGQGFGRR
jgi:hypothetical protein